MSKFIAFKMYHNPTFINLSQVKIITFKDDTFCIHLIGDENSFYSLKESDLIFPKSIEELQKFLLTI